MYAYATVSLKSKPSIFHSLAAFDYAARCAKPMRVVQGEWNASRDSGEFVVVTPADAAHLERAGYEIVA